MAYFFPEEENALLEKGKERRKRSLEGVISLGMVEGEPLVVVILQLQGIWTKVGAIRDWQSLAEEGGKNTAGFVQACEGKNRARVPAAIG